MKVLKFILQTSSPFKSVLILMLLGVLIMAIDSNVRPYIIKLLVDKTEKFIVRDYIFLASCYIASHSLRAIFHAVVDWGATCYSARYREYVSCLALKKINKYPYSFFQDNLNGNIIANISDIFNLVPQLMIAMVCDFIHLVFLVIISLIFLAYINPLCSLLAFLWTGVFCLSLILFSLKGKVLNSKYANTRPAIFGFFSDYFTNIVSVWYFSMEVVESRKLKELTGDFRNKAFEFGKFLRKYHFTQGLITTLYMLINLSFLGFLKEVQEISPGDFTLIFLINYKIGEMLASISQQITPFFVNWGAVKQAVNIFDYQYEIVTNENAPSLIVTKGIIQFDKVIFIHKEREELFQNDSLTIYSGEKVGLVGYSGAGKTTFVNLIMRLHELHEGRILIDGQNISAVNLQSLRGAISIISQDLSLFHRSIADNIKYGSPTATKEQIVQAAIEADAHEFISKLKEGYDSIVGEKGLKLSGGQRQRVCIARAILKNSPILILDEATSQLDAITENEVQNTLWKVMDKKTTLVIAHRLTTLVKMDRILVFDKGNIVEDGTHAELLEKQGLYKKFWDIQAGIVLPMNN